MFGVKKNCNLKTNVKSNPVKRKSENNIACLRSTLLFIINLFFFRIEIRIKNFEFIKEEKII